MITARQLKEAADQRSSLQTLQKAIADRQPVAAVAIGLDTVFAVGSDLLTPALKLMVSGWNLAGRAIVTNYDVTAVERATLRLQNAGTADSDKEDLRITLKTGTLPSGGKYFHQIEPGYGANGVGRFQRLFADAFPLGGAEGPNIDLQREHDVAENKKGTGIHTVHRVYLAAAFALAGTKADGRNVVACIVADPSGRIISWGQKSPDYPTLHAETSAILRYGRKLPKGVRVYTTLSPCQMCGAWIKGFSEEESAIAYFGSNDTTRLAGRTDLGANARHVRQIPDTKGVATGPKPLDLDREGSLGSRGSDLGDRLLATRKSDVGVIDHLSDTRRVEHMRERATAFFRDKSRKYKTPKEGTILNQNVENALAHVTDFLAANRVRL